MSAPVWTIAALLVGIIVMFLGPLFLESLPAQTVWTDEDARAYSKAGADLHNATYGSNHKHDHSRPDPAVPADDPTLVAARAEFQKQEAKLHAAQSRQVWLLWSIRLTGAAISAVGVAGYMQSQRPEQPPRRGHS